MITTGIIKNINNDYTYDVEIGIFKTPGDNNTNNYIVNCSCSLPGGINSPYNIGDPVFISFVNNDYSDAIIIGKIYNELNSKGYYSINDLDVYNSVTLPYNTTIGDIKYNDLYNYGLNISNLNSKLSNIETTTAQNNYWKLNDSTLSPVEAVDLIQINDLDVLNNLNIKQLKLTSLPSSSTDITDDNIIFKGVTMTQGSPFKNTGAELVNIGITDSGYRLVSQLAMPYNGFTSQTNNEVLKTRSYHSASGWSDWHNIVADDLNNTFTGTNNFTNRLDANNIKLSNYTTTPVNHQTGIWMQDDAVTIGTGSNGKLRIDNYGIDATTLNFPTNGNTIIFPSKSGTVILNSDVIFEKSFRSFTILNIKSTALNNGCLFEIVQNNFNDGLWILGKKPDGTIETIMPNNQLCEIKFNCGNGGRVYCWGYDKNGNRYANINGIAYSSIQIQGAYYYVKVMNGCLDNSSLVYTSFDDVLELSTTLGTPTTSSYSITNMAVLSKENTFTGANKFTGITNLSTTLINGAQVETVRRHEGSTGPVVVNELLESMKNDDIVSMDLHGDFELDLNNGVSGEFISCYQAHIEYDGAKYLVTCIKQNGTSYMPQTAPNCAVSDYGEWFSCDYDLVV